MLKELETILCSVNSKTHNYDNFKNYYVEKINYQLYAYYQEIYFRKIKLNSYTNT